MNDEIEKQRAKVAKHQAKLDQMIQEKIEADLKNSKVELKGGEWLVGNYFVEPSYERPVACSNQDLTLGRQRQTKELAESARKEIIRFQRMLAYVDDRGARLDKDGWCVPYNLVKKSYFVLFAGSRSASSTLIRMTEECAKQLADDLNQGRFKLDIE